MAYSYPQQQHHPFFNPPSPPSLAHYYYYSTSNPTPFPDPFSYTYQSYGSNYYSATPNNMVPYHHHPSYPTSHGFCPHHLAAPPPTYGGHSPPPPPPPVHGNGHISDRLSSLVRGVTIGKLVHEAVVFVAGKVCFDHGDGLSFDTSCYDDLIKY